MTMSKRAAERIQAGGGPPASVHRVMAADPWSPDNPDGYIDLAVAENRLVFDLLEPWLAGPRTVVAEDTHYQPVAGSREFLAELARFLSGQRGVEVPADQLMLLGGSSPALDAISYAVCDPGDGIVVPSPYFPGLDHTLGGRAGARMIPAPMAAADGFRLTAEVVEKAIVTADGPVRAVALLSPHNPLGHVYSAATLTEVAEVVRDHDLDLISDEVYAGSVYAGEFVSAAALDVLPPDRVHVVWGFSKDFGMSGLRVGVLSSGDPRVLEAAGYLARLSTVSSDTQALLRAMLADGTFMAGFVQERRRRLADAYAMTVAALDAQGIEYVEAAAGLYVWVRLPAATFEAEHETWQRIFDTAKVNIVPGEAFHCPEPGWFRLCFSSDSRAVSAGIARLGAVVSV